MPTQRSFAAGELAPSLYGGAVPDRYAEGLATARNFLITKFGSAANRPGFPFVAEVKDSTARTYLLKFIFNADQSYALEFGNEYIRFYRLGARIVVSGVTAWSNATNYVVGDLASSAGVNYYCILAQ